MMSGLQGMAEQMVLSEKPLLQEYDELARQAITETERRLVEQMIRAQRFQLAALALVAEGLVPENFHCFGVITHDDVKVRVGPSPRQEEKRRLHQGVPVVVEEYQGNWARIQLPDGDKGWVFRDYVRCELTG